MTHVNAFIAAVSEAETKVAQAQGELEKAKNLLRDKQVELGLLKLEPETPVAEEPASVDEGSEPAVEDSEPDETLAEQEDNKA